MTYPILLIIVLLSIINAVLAFSPPTRTIGKRATTQLRAQNYNDSSTTNPSTLTRRQVGELSIATLGLGTSFLGTRENTPQEYGLWGILPVGTYKTKPSFLFGCPNRIYISYLFKIGFYLPPI